MLAWPGGGDHLYEASVSQRQSFCADINGRIDVARTQITALLKEQRKFAPMHNNPAGMTNDPMMNGANPYPVKQKKRWMKPLLLVTGCFGISALVGLAAAVAITKGSAFKKADVRQTSKPPWKIHSCSGIQFVIIRRCIFNRDRHGDEQELNPLDHPRKLIADLALN
eukprot:GHVT01045864.1.p1 GENE.GHVT01045864.1~~GHVT01045864.1.p1  ORF type:complete len:167 (-),score=8.22 GHVT01045864.1:1201-1701(-)